MKTYVDRWDYLFGKWGEFQIPMPDGSIKKVAATEKWLKSMQALGKISQENVTVVKVNILDHASASIKAGEALLGNEDMDEALAELNRPASPTIEWWEIGKQISYESYQKMKDPQSGELYVLYQNKFGKREIICCTRELWELAKRI